MDISEYGIFNSELETPIISDFDEIDDVEILEVSKITESEYLVKAQLGVFSTVHVFIFKPNYAVADYADEISIINSDWNDHYILAEIPQDLDVVVEFILSRNTKEIKSIDIVSIEHGDCPYCSY